MKKRIVLTLIGLSLLIVLLGGVKGMQIGRMIAHGKQFVPPPETVTTAEVKEDSWESLLTSIGSLEAVQGVTVTAELTGKVVHIAFESGAQVQGGDLLVQQDVSSETAQLRAAEAAVSLAKTNFERSAKLLPAKVISRSDYDDAEAQYKQAMAQADNIRAAVAKKTIRAPFAGRLGIRLVNLGQILNGGDAIVSLQALDPILVNFLLPQQRLSRINTGLGVKVTSDALPGGILEGRITAIDPEVDAATRNIRVQAVLANDSERLRPGMYVNVSVVLPERAPRLVIPATSVLYAPYSDSVFVVEEKPADKTGPPGRAVRQQFVRLGERQGDFVAVVTGLKKGDTVVSTGAFKLRNGQTVVVDNRLAPEFKLAPEPTDS